MEELIIEGKTYISSKRAAEITGYAKDYVGQLCREGRVKARLVGRSWYVLEDSIRAHRFGDEDEVEVPTPKSPEREVWSTPRYVQEKSPELPSFGDPVQPIGIHTPAIKSEALSDMQEAWQEWFNHKQEEILEVVEDELEDVKIQKVLPTEEEQVSIKTPWSDLEDVVTIHRSHSSMPFSEPVEAPAPRAIPHAPLRSARVNAVPERSSRAAKAFIVAVCALVVIATAIGTGFAEPYIGATADENPVFNFLGGQSTVDK